MGPCALRNVHIESCNIKRVTHLKYLGVIIDESLNWSKHVEKTSKEVISRIYLLKRIRPYTCITQQTALVYYKSIIQGKFDYCDVVWDNCAKTYILISYKNCKIELYAQS